MTTLGPLEQKYDGLSKDEHDWLQKSFDRLTERQDQHIKVLKSIHTAIQILLVIVVVSVIVAVTITLLK